MMIDLEERQLMAQTIFALTRCSASPSNGRPPLTQTQIEPLYGGDFCISPRKGIFQHPTASVGVTGTCDNACTIASMSMASGALRNS